MIYTKYNFETRGIGIVSKDVILKNTYIGNYFSKSEVITNESRAIYDGWVETNPLGRYLNHNRDFNCELKLNGDFIELHSLRDINKWEELTINYLTIIDLINLPSEIAKKYQIKDYDYITENIVVKTNIM